MKRLNVVVPFRDREAHLRTFVPSMRAYFARDKLDRNIPYRVIVVEQDAGLPFNRGALKNVGFELGRADSEYTCFHDVDFMPIWADYSWSEQPAALVWYGSEERPLAPGRSELRISEYEDTYAGGVILLPNEQFTQANGYANSYWGWGFEDTDLSLRLKKCGSEFIRRKGTFQPIYHDHEGLDPNGQRKPTFVANEAIWLSRWPPQGDNDQMRDDGLSKLSFEVLDRRPIPEGPKIERSASWEIVKVRLNHKPNQQQMDAYLKHSGSNIGEFVKVPRNSPCPCGSGKKFKHCHGK